MCYAKHIGKERAAEEAAAATKTADEVRAAAAELGYELVPSSKGETGFKNVKKEGNRYVAFANKKGKSHVLGRFKTPEEAALCYAKHIGKERAAEEAAEASNPKC